MTFAASRWFVKLKSLFLLVVSIRNAPLPTLTTFFQTNVTVSAMDVVCLRPSAEARGGSANLQAPGVDFSSRQSDKLYTLLKQLHPRGGYSHTFGALDTVQVTQMGPHLSSIYVSGWQCSSTASTTNEPGPDFADYPMNTVRVCASAGAM